MKSFEYNEKMFNRNADTVLYLSILLQGVGMVLAHRQRIHAYGLPVQYMKSVL